MAVFRYWIRGSDDTCDASSGDRLSLVESREYIVQFFEEPRQSAQRELLSIGAEVVDRKTFILKFLNFVGVAAVAGVTLCVTSAKLGDAGTSSLLEQVSNFSASLIFGSGAPTGFAAGSTYQASGSIPYHQLQILRNSVVMSATGDRFQDFLELIRRNPTHRIEPERNLVGVEYAQRLDQRSIQTMLTRLEWLVPVDSDRNVAATALGQTLQFGTPRQFHFPYKVDIPRGRLSYDTPENRLTNHIIRECLAISFRFAGDPRANPRMQQDCAEIIAVLQQYEHGAIFSEISDSKPVFRPSQAMLKRDGYRQIYSFWQSLHRSYALPLSESETRNYLEGKDVASLYEYWVFLVIADQVRRTLGIDPAATYFTIDDELGTHMRHGFSLSFSNEVVVHFNMTYSRSRNSAYSTPLRPDVVLQIGNRHHIFDAKYKLTSINVNETVDEDDASTLTYKRADLYKMHTYKDAIADAVSAFVVYPGNTFTFFETSGTKHTDPTSMEAFEGVGAVPLRPSESDASTKSLSKLIGKFLQSSG